MILTLNMRSYYASIVVTVFAAIGFTRCKKEVPNQTPVTWFLNHDDSIMCGRIDRKDTFVFVYNDSNNKYSRVINAQKIKTEDLVSVGQAQDVDPSRSMGASITAHSKRYTYWDSLNDFSLLVSIYPTFDQTGTIRLKSVFKMYFNDRFTYLRPIYANGLPGNFIVYDSLRYNNKLYKHCNYSPTALQRNIGIQILDSAGLPLWLENKPQKINIDFVPR